MAKWLIDDYRIENGRIKSPQTIYRYLSDRTAYEIEALKYGLSSTMSKRKVGNPEHFTGSIIETIKERKDKSWRTILMFVEFANHDSGYIK